MVVFGKYILVCKVDFQVTSERALAKPGRLLFGVTLRAFCRITLFSSSKIETFSSRLKFRQIAKRLGYESKNILFFFKMIVL